MSITWKYDERFLAVLGYSQCANNCEYTDKQYILIDIDGRLLTHLSKLCVENIDEFKNSTFLFCGQCAFSVKLNSQRRDEWVYKLISNDDYPHHYYSLASYRLRNVPNAGGRKLLRRMQKQSGKRWKLTQYKQQQNPYVQMLRKFTSISSDIITIIILYLVDQFNFKYKNYYW